MGDAVYARLRELFEAAIDLPPAEQAALLDRECAGDPELRSRLESLLTTAESDDGFLSDLTLLTPLGALGAGGDTDAPAMERPGGRIRRYHLLEAIGEGGFGAVFLAEQRAPVQRRVALKVIKLGMDTRQVIARFEAERQALAKMDHPNIARVLDAGATESGRPYFVMELVEGEPITAYCDRECLTIRQRLELFAQVCAAVQHAHQKGVIHRDIKPANVLVTVADGKPVPKVIDFGIAKAISGRLTDKTLFTEFRQLIGTPEYMSPEQADSGGVDIDTRTDVYSLGVLLYELLTGTTPLDARTLRSASFGEIQRMIREDDPPRPSTRVQTLMSRAVPPVPPRTRHGAPVPPQPQNFSAPPAGASASSVLPTSSAGGSPGAQAPGTPAPDAQRGPDAQGASNRPKLPLSGSLDGALGPPIARKGDATDPGAIARHRRADPKRLSVTLRGELDWIVMKALEKNRARRYETANALAMDIRRYLTQQPVEAGPPSRVYRTHKFIRRNQGGVLAAGMVVVVLVLGMIGTSAGLVWALREADRAEAHARLAEREAARALLAEAEAEQRAKETQAVAEFQAELLTGIEPWAMGRQMREDLMELARSEFSTEIIDPNEIEQEVAELARLLDHVNFTDAARRALQSNIFQDAMESIEARFASQPIVEARLLQSLATALVKLDLAHQAVGPQERALRIRQRELGDAHSDTIDSLVQTGRLHGWLENYGVAEAHLHQAVELAQWRLPTGHAFALDAMNALGLTLQSQGKDGEAEHWFREGLELARESMDSKLTWTATFTGNLAAALHQRERYREAETLYQESLELRRRVFGERSAPALWATGRIGAVLRKQERLAEAEPYLRERLDGYREVYGNEHTRTIDAMHQLAVLLRERGNLTEAEQLSAEALRASPWHTRGSVDWIGLGYARILAGLERFAEAETRMLAIHERFETACAAGRLAQRVADEFARTLATGLAELYEAMHAAEPDAGHGAKAAGWRARLQVAESYPDL